MSKPNPIRKHVRIKGFDYRENFAYFVTICTGKRRHAFGEITNGIWSPTQRGRIAQDCWLDIPNHHPFVELDAFTIMPNHMHGILCFVGPPVAATPASLCVRNGNSPVAATPASLCVRNGNSPVAATPASLCVRNGDSPVAATPASLCVRNGNSPVAATPASPPRAHGPLSQSLGAAIGSYKSAVSRTINKLRPGAATELWQPNYYEHIIRSDRSLDRIRQYIDSNVQRWDDDEENESGTRGDKLASFIESLLADESQSDAGVAATKSQSDAGVAATEIL